MKIKFNVSKKYLLGGFEESGNPDETTFQVCAYTWRNSIEVSARFYRTDNDTVNNVSINSAGIVCEHNFSDTPDTTAFKSAAIPLLDDENYFSGYPFFVTKVTLSDESTEERLYFEAEIAINPAGDKHWYGMPEVCEYLK